MHPSQNNSRELTTRGKIWKVLLHVQSVDAAVYIGLIRKQKYAFPPAVSMSINPNVPIQVWHSKAAHTFFHHFSNFILQVEQV